MNFDRLLPKEFSQLIAHEEPLQAPFDGPRGIYLDLLPTYMVLEAFFAFFGHGIIGSFGN